MGAAVTPLLIVAIVALNYIPSVLFALDMGIDAATVALVVVFHLLLGLMIVAWSFTCATDPGVPPEWWQRQMAGEAAAGRDVPRICAKSGLYKPPRSHYCSVTGRLTLNMDHFCPWVVNTVGFYNRKFFMLFLIYADLTMFVAILVLVAQMPHIWNWLQDEAGGVAHWFPPYVNMALFGGALMCIRAGEVCFFFDWAESKLVRRIDVQPREIKWSESGDLLVVVCEESFFVLRYNRELVSAAFDSGAPIGEEGVDDAFEVVHEISEAIRTCVWVGDCLLYTSTAG